MKIILIPCSGSKVPGGKAFSRPSKLMEIVSTESYKKLLSARDELSAIIRDKQSTGLGFKDSDENDKYLPAVQRYKGLIYAHSDITRLFPFFNGVLIIISAMYGLLDGNDLIRNYELKMNDTLPNGMRVSTFWRRHELRNILLELISSKDDVEVHDLLSGHYREALRPWPDLKLINNKIYEYPGMGQGSSFARAKDLKRLLSNGLVY